MATSKSAADGGDGLSQDQIDEDELMAACGSPLLTGGISGGTSAPAAKPVPAGAPAPGLPLAWQSEKDLPLRRRMITTIVRLLQARKPNAPTAWVQKLPDMARRLEVCVAQTLSRGTTGL